MIQLKSDDDIAYIKEAGEILYEAVRAMRAAIAPGITTHELDAIAKHEIVKRGATPAFLGYHGYPASVCISINEEVIHGIPGKRRLSPGDIVGLDIGVVFRGYIADAAVTIPVGDIEEKERLLLTVTEECLYRGIEKARAGNRARDISEAIYSHATAHGFDVVREYCGHGVGFELHEDPQIFNYPASGPNQKLKEGMVIAIEPMVNMGTWKVKLLSDGWTVVTDDGRKSAHFEHTIAIRKDGAEILTRW
jgi:methionyl aminopeptidase